MATAIILVSFFVGTTSFGLWRLLVYLRFLQQEEYDTTRFPKWVIAQRLFDRKGTAVALLTGVIAAFFGASSLASILSVLATGLLIVIAYREPDPRKEGKITLKMTARASRIYRGAATILVVGVLLLLCFLGRSTPAHLASVLWLSAAVLFQLTPLFLVLAVSFLQPGEEKRQRQFLDEAKEKIRLLKPYTVGITGSYGKTSTKAILGELMSASLGPTFWPPKSINTPMGVTREIRERLNDSFKYAVFEMGAYRPGSITRLCELTPPDAAIITAVGVMHYGRMGGAEKVLEAKAELAQAVPENGILVVNGDNAGAREIAKRYPKQTTLLYGLNDDGSFAASIKERSMAIEGTEFEVTWQGETFLGSCKMHGTSALSNILAAFTMSCALGADPQYVLATVASLGPVDNRLAVERKGDFTQINDAYNSNPAGFRAALDVLKKLPGKRKVLITPGIIDLGEIQEQENEAVGELAASICDVLYVVGEVNKTAIKRGANKGGAGPEMIREFTDRDSALAAFFTEKQAEDVVLIENDLPDLFEIDVRL